MQQTNAQTQRFAKPRQVILQSSVSVVFGICWNVFWN